jgi:predicted transcriptional regulator
MVDTQKGTTVRLPRALVEQMHKVAQAHDRSLSAEMRVALTEYVNEHERAAHK